MRAGISAFLQPLIDRGIPFAVTYGNHDAQCGLSPAELDALYREFPGCINPPCNMDDSAANPGFLVRSVPSSGLPDQPVAACEPGTFAMPVLDQDRQRAVLGLVVLNSGDYAREGRLWPAERRRAAFRARRAAVARRPLPVFQHMPLPQFYDVLKAMPANADNAIPGGIASTMRSITCSMMTGRSRAAIWAKA